MKVDSVLRLQTLIIFLSANIHGVISKINSRIQSGFIEYFFQGRECLFARVYSI
jgi:hypothetical protein